MRDSQARPSLPKAVGLFICFLVPLLYNLLVGPLILKPRLSSTVYALVGYVDLPLVFLAWMNQAQ
jgi:hypothetical protein